MDLTLLGWRDVILMLVVFAAVYLVIVLFRLIQVGRKGQRQEHMTQYPADPAVAEPSVPEVPGMLREQPPVREPLPLSTARGVSAYEEVAAAAESEASFGVPSVPTFEWDDVKDLFGEDGASPATQPAAPATVQSAATTGGGFGEHLSEHLVRSDMAMEMQRMRDEMQRMKQELEELRMSRRVSPQYAEAMELAQRGMSAQDMADRLGISLAEAELVYALSRGQQDFD